MNELDGFRLTRLTITMEFKNFFIGVDSENKKRYKIVKNDYSKNFTKGFNSYIRYRIINSGIFFITIDPISHEDFIEIKEKVTNKSINI